MTQASSHLSQKRGLNPLCEGIGSILSRSMPDNIALSLSSSGAQYTTHVAFVETACSGNFLTAVVVVVVSSGTSSFSGSSILAACKINSDSSSTNSLIASFISTSSSAKASRRQLPHVRRQYLAAS